MQMLISTANVHALSVVIVFGEMYGITGIIGARRFSMPVLESALHQEEHRLL